MNSLHKTNKFFNVTAWVVILNELASNEKLTTTTLNKKLYDKYGDSTYSYVYNMITGLKELNYLRIKDKVIVLSPKGKKVADIISSLSDEVNK